jgi:leucyl aminopeptidase (aminopeptidase T)/transposase
MRIAPAVSLSPEERAHLQRLARAGPRSARRLRARIVLRAAAGEQNREIARAESVSRVTVARWRDRFRRLRLPGLEDQDRPALSAPSVASGTVRQIVRATLTRPPAYRRAWTTRSLAREFGVSHMTVRRIWQAYRIRPIRFDSWPLRPDPAAPLVPGDVLGLFLRPPEGVLVISLVPRASRRSGGSLGPPSGPREPIRPASVLPSSPEFRAAPSDLPTRATRIRDSPQELLRFLGGLGRRVEADAALRLVGTAGAFGDPEPLDRWRARRPNTETVLVPGWEEWKGRVARELRELGRIPSPASASKSRAEAVRSLSQFVHDYGDRTGAFEWLAPRRSARAGDAAFRLRYDLAVTDHPGFKSPPPLASTVVASRAPDAQTREMARNVLRNCLRVKPGEKVTIDSWTATLPEANAMVLEALDLGARPLLLYQDEPTYWAATAETRLENLGHLGEHRKAAIEHTDVLVSFFGPSDRERFHALPAAVNSRLWEYNAALYRAAARSGARSAQIALGRASPASARMYGVDLATWRKELVEGCLVPPPELRRRGAPLAAALSAGRELRISHPNGTDLKLRLRRRKAQLSDGFVPPTRQKRDWNLVTLPAGVVVVAVDERFAEGSFHSNVRSAIGMSDTVGEVAGGRWIFERGHLARFSYEEGGELFSQSYAKAGAGRDLPGSLSVGLNDSISVSPLLEDQSAGTVSFHIGRNDHVGGSTSASWWAWLFLRGATVSVDGRTILKEGKWVR